MQGSSLSSQTILIGIDSVLNEDPGVDVGLNKTVSRRVLKVEGVFSIAKVGAVNGERGIRS